jgi:dTMP kinase
MQQSSILKPSFITIEGIEGVGKSTCVEFIKQFFIDKNIPLVVTREPGGTKIGEQIRNILLMQHTETMAVDTELLLIFASRAQHIAEVILPSLQANKWVLSDRFTDASYAYQGGGREMSMEQIAILENFVHKNFTPDLTLLLTAPVEMALTRMKHRNDPDRFESEQAQFFVRAQEVYLARAEKFPERFRIIDASQPLEKVTQQISQILTTYLQQKNYA